MSDLQRKKNDRRRNRKRSNNSSHSNSPRISVSISISVSKSSESSSSSSDSKSRSRSREADVKQPEKYKSKNHENQVLVMENLSEEVSKQQLDMILNESAVEMQVSRHEEINIIQAFGTAYIKYPNVESARKVLQHLKGKIQIGEHNIEVDFYEEQVPDYRRKKVVDFCFFQIYFQDSMHNTGQGGMKQLELKNSLMNQPPATSYDWICDKCQYENFAKVSNIFYKIKRDKNATNVQILGIAIVKYYQCLLHLQIQQLLFKSKQSSDHYLCRGIDTTEPSFNTSLMIRGKSIVDATESEILDVFQQMAPVKDIRLVQNKSTGGTKDFAFVEFFTMDDTENVFRRVSMGDIKLRGEQISIQYSKSSKNQRFFEDHIVQLQFNQAQQQASLSGVGDLPSYYDQQNYYNYQQNQYATPTNTSGYYQQYQQPFVQMPQTSYAPYNYGQQQQYQYQKGQWPQTQAATVQQTVQQAPAQTYLQYQQAQTQLLLQQSQQTQQQQGQPQLQQQQQISTPLNSTQQSQQQTIQPSKQQIQISVPLTLPKIVQQEISQVPKKTDIVEIKLQTTILPTVATQDPKKQETNKQQNKKQNLRTKEIDFDILNQKDDSDQEEPISKAQKELDARKKVEMELKKWQKQQQQQTPVQPTSKVTNDSQQPSKQLSTQPQQIKPPQATQNQPPKKELEKPILQNKPNEQQNKVNQKPILIICPICSKKFINEEIQMLHEEYSETHKNNLRALELIF